MKEIYQDGSIPSDEPTTRSYEDISSVSRPQQPSAPTRPNRQPPEPPLTAAQRAQSASQQPPQAQMMNMPGYPTYAPYPMAPQPTQAIPQSGIPVGAVYPAGMPYPQAYAPYPYYPQPVMYPPQGYQQPINNAPPKMEVATGSDPGTRVLFQSEDFDTSDRDDSYPAVSYTAPSYRPVYQQSPYTSADVPSQNQPMPIILSEDVSVEEINLSVGNPRRAQEQAASAPQGVSVDEMEMSAFELGAMAYKKRTTSKAMRQPGIKKKTDAKPKEIGIVENIEVENYIPVLSPEEEQTDKKGKKKKKKLSKGEIIRRVVLSVSLIAIVGASATLLNEYRLSKENEQLEEEISNLIIDVPTIATSPDGETVAPQENDKKDEDEEDPITPEELWAQVKKKYPDVNYPDGFQLKYANLYGENQDFVGYLSAEGVNLSLPIVQTTDDKYYLNKNFYGKSTKYGCPFVTHLNNIEELDQNTVIFGHHMNDGTVFGALDAYKSIEGFKDAPVITFNTIYKDYQWKVIAAFITNAEGKDDNGYVFRYYFTTLSTQDRFSAFLNELSQRSLYDTGVDVLATDKLLTLSTCSHEFDDARFVVVARLVRDGESPKVDTSLATENSSPRYPQAYYTKKGKTNPYKDASRWQVG